MSIEISKKFSFIVVKSFQAEVFLVLAVVLTLTRVYFKYLEAKQLY